MEETQRPAYEVLGGEEPLRCLVDRFYQLMDTVPEYYGIRKLHPEDLDSSAQKLFMFLSGWLGGPPLFAEQYGHPRLRARHLPFSIGTVERDQWMACMKQAMEEEGIEEPLRQVLLYAMGNTADWMRNKEG
ncbi:MAG TPA: group II truncated hemoglobin [Burkholderiales bacterium]|nr:group II truncated hemoglobin [Burkholderiales bacterium]